MSRAHREGRTFYSQPEAHTVLFLPFASGYCINGVVYSVDTGQELTAPTIVPSSLQDGGGNFPATPDLIQTLIDLARQGQREDFEFLARSSGCSQEELCSLWEGTRRRLGLHPSEAAK